MNSCRVSRAKFKFLCIASWMSVVTSLSLHQPNGNGMPPPTSTLSRRYALLNGMGVLTGGSLATTVLPAEATTAALSGEAVGSFDAYGVRPDASASLSPSLESVMPSQFLDVISMTGDEAITKGGACWLGEHHNSRSDHALQADFIRSIHKRRKDLSCPPMAIGLEQVQRQFQPVLDDFVAGKISVAALRKGVQWEKRWVWPFSVYEDIFFAARELKIPMIALNVDSEDLGPVEREGYPALGKERLRRYIKDPVGFADFSKPLSYKTYVDYVIKPSYDLHKEMGILRTTITGQQLEEDMSFRNFFSGRILWDEAMAMSSYEWTMSNPGGLIVGLVGADHVKFRDGVPGRYGRMVAGGRKNVSVMLNPTLIDTRRSGSVSNIPAAYSTQFPERLTLQLRYLKEGGGASVSEMQSHSNTGGVLPLADYIVISNPTVA